MSDSLRPHRLYSSWNSPGQNTGVGSCSLLQGDLPNPGIEPRSPALQADSLPAEPPAKPYIGTENLKLGMYFNCQDRVWHTVRTLSLSVLPLRDKGAKNRPCPERVETLARGAADQQGTYPKAPTFTPVVDQSTFTGAGRKEGPPPPVPVHPGQPESGCSGARRGRNATQKMDETELILRESIPRQADKKSRSSQGVLKEGLGFSRKR